MPTEIMTFNQKMALLQAKLKPVKKSERNPHFGNKYADINGVLEMVKPLLDEVGLLLVQPIMVKEGRMGVNTLLMDAEGDGTLESWMPLPDVADPQKVGAAITYFRRYAIVALLCLEAEDNDGEETRGIEAPQPRNEWTAPAQDVPRGTDYVAKLQEGKAGAVGTQCMKCGVGKNVINPKTGSLFCDQKCWTKPAGPAIAGDLVDMPF